MKLLNFFLSALPREDFAALSEAMAEVSLTTGQVLFEPNDDVDALYFPGSGCISVVTLMQNGKAIESSTVGRESAVGLLDAMTEERAHARMFAQIAGSATRMSSAAFRARLVESPQLLRLALRHVRASNLQTEQGVACNIAHDVHGRLARWLLMTQDRVGADTFPLTQEYMSVMTGVQRSTVSVEAARLKRAGAISYLRGVITVRDRKVLIKHACECYGVIGDQFEALRRPSTEKPA